MGVCGKREAAGGGGAYDADGRSADGSQADLDDLESAKAEGSSAWGEANQLDEDLPRLTREQLLQHLDERRAKFRHVKSIPFTIMLLVVYILTLFAHLSIDETRAISSSVNAALTAPELAATAGGIHVGYRQVGSLPQVWSWLSGVLLPLLFKTEEEWVAEKVAIFQAQEAVRLSNGSTVVLGAMGEAEEVDQVPSQKATHAIQRYTMAVGGLLFKHVRAYAAVSCPNQDATKLFYKFEAVTELCYPENLPAAPCWENSNCTWRNGSIAHELAPEVKNDTRAQLGNEIIFLPLEEHRPAAIDLLSAAETKLEWLDRSTIAMVVEMPIFNPESGIYGLVRMRMAFDRAGTVTPTMSVTTLPSVVDSGTQVLLRFFGVILLTLLFVEEGWELVQSVHARQRFEYCTNGWTMLDWLVILLAVYLISEYNFYRVDHAAAEDNLLGDAALPATYTDISLFIEYFDKALTRFERMRAFGAAFLLVLVLRLFKGLRIHTPLGLLAAALSRALHQASAFVWLFGAVYLVWATVGHLLFGNLPLAPQFKSVGSTAQHLFGALLGGGQQSWNALRTAVESEGSGFGHELVATMYFWLFFVVCFYLMLSLLLAIVIDSYNTTKCSHPMGLPLWSELKSVWKLWRARKDAGESLPRPLRHLGAVAEAVEASHRTVFTGADAVHELGLSAVEAEIVMGDCQLELQRQDDADVQGGGGGGGEGGWSATVIANHSECLARLLEGVTAIQMELGETKLRVNNMAARMGINTRHCHVQTHLSYQPSNRLTQQDLPDQDVYSAPMLANANGSPSRSGGAALRTGGAGFSSPELRLTNSVGV